ncbi:hypothetical protein CCYA_CCYA06G1807 [Cyanidiococcus yangmingshanensis]|nr:hypothetical protein CCYA_CCYA06G1807 [Cyanidiococcus yangmingshanensis]
MFLSFNPDIFMLKGRRTRQDDRRGLEERACGSRNVASLRRKERLRVLCCQAEETTWQQSVLPRLVLVGGGHAHAHVLRTLLPRREGFFGILISIEEHALYSGMLPGRIAQQYRADQTRIDLVRLAASSGWLFIRGRVAGIYSREKRLQVEITGPDASPMELRLYYDVLSVDVGSATRFPSGLEAYQQEFVISTRPILKLEAFMERFIQKCWNMEASSTVPLRLLVMGGGAAGAELTFALQRRFESVVGPSAIQLYWLVARPSPLPAHVQRLVEKLLRQRGVMIVHVENDKKYRIESRLSTESPKKLDPHCEDAPASGSRFVLSWSDAVGRSHCLSGDLLILATGAAALGWLATCTDLAVSADGYLRVRPTLQSFTSDDVFAAGDCIAWGNDSESSLPKAGVYAVRQAPVLADNLRQRLRILVQRAEGIAPRLRDDSGMREFRPQQRYLSILNTADGRGIAYRGQWMAYGRWVWHWKNMLDHLWMARYPRPHLNATAEPEHLQQHRPNQGLQSSEVDNCLQEGVSSRTSLREQGEIALVLRFCGVSNSTPRNASSRFVVSQDIEDEATRALAMNLWRQFETSDEWRRELIHLEQQFGISCRVTS